MCLSMTFVVRTKTAGARTSITNLIVATNDKVVHHLTHRRTSKLISPLSSDELRGPPRQILELETCHGGLSSERVACAARSRGTSGALPYNDERFVLSIVTISTSSPSASTGEVSRVAVGPVAGRDLRRSASAPYRRVSASVRRSNPVGPCAGTRRLTSNPRSQPAASYARGGAESMSRLRP